jgi:mRNA interferase RelE/StbE
VGSYRLGFKPIAVKQLEGLPPRDRKRVVERIRALAHDPRPFGSEKLSGEEKYRVRQGDFRVVYGIDDDAEMVSVVRIGHRRDIYR